MVGLFDQVQHMCIKEGLTAWDKVLDVSDYESYPH